MNFDDAMNFINTFSHNGKKVTDLSRISALLNNLGNPHKKLKFVHIAGTNGKGSVLEYCSNAFINAGYKTGQFTSPFINTYCDRIRINGINISEENVAKHCNTVKQAVSSSFYSQFEITFAIALLYFLDEKCDIIFLETGLGGTLDATNIIDSPLASVITSVSVDHTAILGNTVEEIAVHKLGIIKNNSLCVLSYNNIDSVKQLALNKTIEMNSKLIIPDESNLKIISQDINGTDIQYKSRLYHISMCGYHQIVNALTAIETLEILNNYFNIYYENIKKALSDTGIGSRIEIMNTNPEIIIDGGHNEAGIDSLINTLKNSGINNVVGIFGMVEGKPVDYAIKRFSEIFTKVYCVDGYISNNISASVLKDKFSYYGIAAEASDCLKATENAVKYAKKNNSVILACGSLYSASQIKKCIKSILN